jgi:hypothetical protein
MSAWELTTKAVREGLTADYATAKQAGLPNLELVRSVFSPHFVPSEQFYQICFQAAKEIVQDPYVIHMEKGPLRSVVHIRFVHNLPTPVHALPEPLQKELGQLAKADRAAIPLPASPSATVAV